MRANRSYVERNAGVYFFAYSVPETILVNRGIKADLGPGAAIFHHSIVRSDGEGKVETITAGPAETGSWLRQLGFTPLKPQIAFLAHPDGRLITGNFDTTPWNHPDIAQAFIKTNWEDADFDFAKNYIRSFLPKITSVGYNLAGHNSNSLVRLIWSVVCIDRGIPSRSSLDHPNVLLEKFFRPGSKHDIFDSSHRYYADLLANWFNIARIAGHGTLRLSRDDLRRLLTGNGGDRAAKASKWWRKWRLRD